MGDFFATLPIYSAWYKNTGQKIRLVFPKNFPFVESVREFLMRFDFIETVIVSSFEVSNFDCGGLPYKWNPNEYGVDCKTWYNLGFRHAPNKFVANFCAEEYGLDVDENFQLDIDFDESLNELYKGIIGFADASTHRDDYGYLENIMIKAGLNYHKFDTATSIETNLKIAKHCKYVISAGSALSVLLSFSRIPLSVFTWQTPPHLFYKPSQYIHSIWPTPKDILNNSKEDILKFLNIRGNNNVTTSCIV
jgi:hypothetical protein